jgi:DNA-binding transcriptional regulator LsrR (DeoR family)
LKKEVAVERIFKMAALSDFTIVGIGGINADATIIKNGVLTTDDYLILKKKGAVGDILSHFININGNLVDTDLEKRLMSPALADIEKYNNVVGVAGGSHKVKAIYAVLTGKYLDILITDETTATAVLELHQKNSHK